VVICAESAVTPGAVVVLVCAVLADERCRLVLLCGVIGVCYWCYWCLCCVQMVLIGAWCLCDVSRSC